MGFKIEIKGVDELTRNLRRLGENARALDGTRSVPVKELLTESFVGRHTRPVMSQAAWLAAAPPLEEQDQADATSSNALDGYVRSTTTFGTWQAMLDAATKEYVTAQLFR